MKTVFGRKAKSAVSPVIGTILMVAITVVLAAVLYVMVSGLGPGSTTTNTTLVMQGGSNWINASGNNTFTFTIMSVTPTSANVDPTQVTFTVANSAGTSYYSGTEGNPQTTSGFTVDVNYQDTTEAGKVSSGDSIQILIRPTYPTNPLTGGKLNVFFQGAQISTGTT